ncbi:MAG: helix-turn-helix domain-containing protein [Solirubrobacteraceae bacterium]
MATDLLSTICREIDERLNELRPLLAERQRLLVAAEALVEAGQDGTEIGAQPAGDPTVDSRAVGVSVKRSRQSAPKPKLKSKPKSESAPQPEAKPERAARGAAREAILGALEHGSHTVGELAVVTAMSGPNINGNLRRLEAEGVVVKAEREGKAAWALVDATG